MHLVDGRARAAAVYPDQLCKAICAGIRAQIDHDNQRQRGELPVGSLCVNFLAQSKYCQNDEKDADCTDDVTGLRLDPILMRKARKVEMDLLIKRELTHMIP